MSLDLRQLDSTTKGRTQALDRLVAEIEKVVVGQRHVIERLLVGLLAGGHVLLEGVPGLAKTLAAKTLAAGIQARFRRLQFTPDLLPADLIGTQVYHPRTGDFHVKRGPIFAHLILADEINRAPAKVQSALLEAMQEKQVTIGDETFALEVPFLVLATQNPIEQEGTYPLPEAQVDRFMLKVKVGYPDRAEERRILDRMATTQPALDVEPVLNLDDVLRLRAAVDQIYIDDKVKDYIVALVFATREPQQLAPELGPLIQYGASPRASIYLTLAAKAYALLMGRAYVVPHDVKSVAMDVLRHRLILSYEAEAEGKTPEELVTRILDTLEVP